MTMIPPSGIQMDDAGEVVLNRPAETAHAAAAGEGALELLFTGDFYPGGRAEDLCLRGAYDDLFNEALPLLHHKDLSVTNLEGPLTRAHSPVLKDGPHLSAVPQCVGALQYAGFDVALLANNHICDHGLRGLKDTIDVCRAAGINAYGAEISRPADAGSSDRPLLLSRKGRTVAILNFTENEFSATGCPSDAATTEEALAAGSPALGRPAEAAGAAAAAGEAARSESASAHALDPASNYYQILRAKSMADFVVVAVHGGHERYPLPSPRMVQTYRFFADLGVNAVIGHHPHVASGFEIYHGVPIFYSLGNFLFDPPAGAEDDSWHLGYFVRLSVRDAGVSRLTIHPYSQFREGVGIHLLEGAEKTAYLATIRNLSEIIGCERELRRHWQHYCADRSASYLKRLLRLNRVGTALLRRRLGPGFIARRQELAALLNLFRCEAHREVSIEVLEQQLHDPGRDHL